MDNEETKSTATSHQVQLRQDKHFTQKSVAKLKEFNIQVKQVPCVLLLEAMSMPGCQHRTEKDRKHSRKTGNTAGCSTAGKDGKGKGKGGSERAGREGKEKQ